MSYLSATSQFSSTAEPRSEKPVIEVRFLGLGPVLARVQLSTTKLQHVLSNGFWLQERKSAFLHFARSDC